MDFKLQVIKYISLLLASPCWSQFANMEMRPDVIFDERNDRYDISSLVAHQNRYFARKEAEVMMENRRNNQMDLLAAELMKKVENRKELRDFAYHDQMNSQEGGDEFEFNRNLMNFQPYRRVPNDNFRRSGGGSADLGKEALSHYAVPIDMKINGYIQAPLVD